MRPYPRLDDAQRRQVESLVPLIRGMADRKAGLLRMGPLLADELASAAFMRLCRAIPRYDPRKGASLTTWACRHVLGAFSDLLREREGVFGPNRCGRKPTALMFSAMAGEDGETGFDSAAPSRGTASAAGWDEWDAVLRMVPGRRDRLIVHLRFAEGLPMAEIGDRLGISGSRVSQRLTALMLELRGRLSAREEGVLGRRRIAAGGAA